MKNKISNRLEAIIELVSRGSYPADIGSDHAYIPLELIKRNIVDKVFAVENKLMPYKRMEKTVMDAKLSSQIICSFSNGISKIPVEVNELILAGMGGQLIASILLNDKDKLNNIEHLVIDAHKEYPYLLKILGNLGFLATKDIFLVDKNKSYCIYYFNNVHKEVIYSDEELYFGPIEIKKRSKEWLSFYQNVLLTKQNIIADNTLPTSVKEKLEKELIFLKENIG